jgi:hypothetical protein
MDNFHHIYIDYRLFLVTLLLTNTFNKLHFFVQVLLAFPKGKCWTRFITFNYNV